MGKITKPRGLKGGLSVLIYNKIESSLRVGKIVWIKLEHDNYEELVIESLSISSKNSWIKFLNYNNREEVFNLVGLEFLMLRSDFIQTKNEDIYLFDFVGISVINEDFEKIGIIIDTMVMPAHNMLLVDSNGKEIMVPLVEKHIKFFDKKKNILILKNVEGLLD